MNANLVATLQNTFGFEDFRPGQNEAIEHLLAGRHTLVVMPTGAGKSLVYQLTTLHQPGLTLVISPLIALMKDQVDSLTRHKVPSTLINSTLSAEEQTARLQALAQNAYRIVYVAPERLRSVAFLQALSQVKIGLMAVDEAHCISQWGHDFRPDYLHIAAVRGQLGNPVTAALTATATPQVQNDIVRLLELSSAERIVTGFNRPNLSFIVRYTTDSPAKLQELQHLLTDWEEGAAIIYTGTRRDAEEVAEFICSVCGLEARHYHAGLDTEVRTQIQDDFIAGELPIVVATNAFGMGIDRADVRLVAHYSIPGTLEAYYQEAGRAGRDGEAAQAVLLYAPKDRALQEWFIDNAAVTPEEMRSLYQALGSKAQKETWMALDDFSLVTGLPEVKVKLGLSQLEAIGSLERLGDAGSRMLLRRGKWNDAAVEKTAADAEIRKGHRRKQLEQMIAYAESNSCRRNILLEHFGDRSKATADRCCDNCLALRAAEPAIAPDTAAELPDTDRIGLIFLDALRRLKWEVGRTKLAQLLKGSRSRDMKSYGYENSIYYGRLAAFTLKEIEEMIGELISSEYLKVIGGDLPVLRLTPNGLAAIKARTPVPLQLGRKVSPEVMARVQAERKIGDTVLVTAQMVAQGLTPSQIAVQRGLTEGTIYTHLSKLIGAGELPLSAILSDQITAQIRAAIDKAPDGSGLTFIKESLPDTISYGQIRCVIAAIQHKQGIASPFTKRSSAELRQRIWQLGEMRASRGLPELITALEDVNGNVRRLAASALGKIGDRAAVKPLLILLKREHKPQVRQYAVKALGSIADPTARETLQKIASDSRERDYTRASALLALRNLSPQARHENDVANFLAQPHPRPLTGPWHAGWALGFHSSFSGADWNRSTVGDLAYRLKYQSDSSVVQPLVEQALALMGEYPEMKAVDGLVPVPPSETRSLDPVNAFASALGQQLGRPVWKALIKTRQTAPQKEMRTLAQKRANVAGAFAVNAAIQGKRLLVIDDLYDSGATLEEVSRTLRQAGATNICVLTLTRTIHSDA